MLDRKIKRRLNFISQLFVSALKTRYTGVYPYLYLWSSMLASLPALSVMRGACMVAIDHSYHTIYSDAACIWCEPSLLFLPTYVYYT